MYETNSKGGYVDYGEIVTILNEKLVNINMGGARDAQGNLIILEAVAVEGNFIPKIGDWVNVEWRNGSPVAVGGDSSGLNTGLTNINENVKIISQGDLANGVVNGDHIRANSIEAIHIEAQSIQAQHISANAITTVAISANAITGDKIAAGVITAVNISANAITGDKIAAGTIQAVNISANTITGDKVVAGTISGNHIAAGTIDVGKLTVSAREQGLLGQYFTNTGGANKFETFKGSRIETVLNYNWVAGSPSIVGQGDNFAIRFQGLIFAPETGSYNFYGRGDDSTKVWIDNTLVLTTVNSSTEAVGTITLAANTWYTIRIDYSENTGNALFYTKWKLPSQGGANDIPAMYLTQSQTVIDGGTILTSTIDAAAIKVGTITAASGVIGDLAITTANIQNAAITGAKIGNAEIKTANIASGNITTALIADASITNAKIVNLDASKINTGFLNAGVISGGSITGDKIAAGTITGQHISANTIDSNQIKAGAITTIKIAAGTITGDRIAADTISSKNILAGSISAEHISTIGLDANIINVYNAATGQVLIGGGYLRVDGLDVGVVQSDNLIGNGLFLTASSGYGMIRDNDTGEAILGNISNLPGAHEIWKYDAATGDVIGKLAIPAKKPVDFAIDMNGQFGYVTVQGDNTLVQVDLQNFALTGDKLNMGTGPSRLMYTGDMLEDMKHFFILNNDPSDNKIPDSLIVVDAPPASVDNDLYVHHWIELGNTPYDMVMHNKLLYVTQAGQGDIAVLDMSDHNSTRWKVVGNIPIAAYSTDNYHGGLEGFFGLGLAVGGSASSAYDSDGGGTGAAEATGEHAAHVHSGYGNPTGSMKTYEPHGIAQSTDDAHLYVCDFKNNELLVVDKYGKAAYNDLTGLHSTGNMGELGVSMGMPMNSGNTGGDMMDMPGMNNSGEMNAGSPASAMLMDGGGPTTRHVRYRIPIGNSPDFVMVKDGKVFVTLQGSAQVAVIDEQDILDEIAADRTYYSYIPEDGDYSDNPFLPMRDLPTFSINYINVGPKPSKMADGGAGSLFVIASGENRAYVIDTTSLESSWTATGPNPKGICFSNDKSVFYVVNHGGSGDLSFVYSKGPYIGDAFLGLEGGINLQGAEFWMPDRSSWVYDASGNVQSYSTIEFRINEPFLNEGGYARMALVGKDYQYTQIEQDIFTVTNYSNGNNLVVSTDERLGLLNPTGNTIFQPRNPWLNNPTPLFKVFTPLSGGGFSSSTPASNQYTVLYGDSARITFSGGIVPSGGYVTATYTARNNLYHKPHNGSILIAVENGSSPNFSTTFEVDEFVPKFVVFDNQQTSPFTPTADGINEAYSGLEYSLMTNRAKGATVTSSVAPVSGNLGLIVDDAQPYEEIGDHTGMDMFPIQPFVTLPSGNQWVQIDLGKKYMIGQITVSHMFEDYDRKYHNTKTQVSADGTNWITVYDSAVSGEYNEKPVYHDVHGHTHYAKVITFDAKPVRYIRDYANGWVSGDGLTSGSQSNWTEIKAFGDWEVEEGFVYPVGSEFAGQQMATNGQCVVTTDIQDAYVAYDMQIEFTSWWYMTYIVGPQFGRLKVEMPSMGGDHFLPLDAPYLNKIAHRHIMTWSPSNNIKANAATGVKAGKHRAVIRQVSGKVSLDRFRIEDYQYYARNSLLVQNQTTSSFSREKIVAEQTKWYVGQGRQATEGAYDAPRKNPDTGIADGSVPVKYRVRVKSELNANGTTQERGISYVTSAIFETGKLHTHWRRSESVDSIPSNKLQQWDANQPHNTGIQTGHIANGAIRGAKILSHAIMDYHVSPYARIEEYKLNLKHPTHRHGRTVILVGQGPMGTDLPVFYSNKDFLDSLLGYAGSGGTFGTGNTVARGDHNHNDMYLKLTGGAIAGNITITGNISATGTISSPTITAMSGNIATISGTVATHTAQIAAVSGTVATHTTQIAAISGTVATHTTQIAGLSGNLNTQVSTLSGNIAGLSGSVSTQATQIAGLSGNLAGLSGSVTTSLSTHTTQIAGLSGNLAGLSGSVSTLTTNFSGLNGSVAGLSGTVAGHIGSNGASHAIATASLNGFMSASDFTKLAGVQTSAINQTTADGRYLRLTGGVLSGSLVVTAENSFIGVDTGQSRMGFYKKVGAQPVIAVASGVAFQVQESNQTDLSVGISGATVTTLLNVNSSSVSYKGNTMYHAGNFVTGNYVTMTYLSGNYYSMTQTYSAAQIDTKVAAAGDIRAASANVFTNTNTFRNAGQAIKVYPTANVAAGIQVVQVQDFNANDLFTIDSSGNVTVRGNLNVSGSTVYQNATTTSGNQTIVGSLTVSGNTNLGGSSTDTTTIKGTMLIPSGTVVKQIGIYNEVHRRPLYGIAGDMRFQTDTVGYESVSEFNGDLAGYASPQSPSGATRYYRLYAIYGDDITQPQASGGQSGKIRLSGNTVKDFNLSYSWWIPDARRDWYSPYFTDIPAGNVDVYAGLAQSGNNLGIRWIELLYYDVYL
jgi:hypothetical protein